MESTVTGGECPTHLKKSKGLKEGVQDEGNKMLSSGTPQVMQACSSGRLSPHCPESAIFLFFSSNERLIEWKLMVLLGQVEEA